MKYLIICLLLIIGNYGFAQGHLNVLNLEFYLPSELEKWYGQNHEKNIISQSWILCDIYSEPNVESNKIGQLVTYFEPEVNNFIIQFLSLDGSVKKELREIGDWGYGIHLNVIDATKEYARLPETYLEQSAWVRMGNQPQFLNAGVTSYLEQIVYLPTVKASIHPEGQLITLKSGNYVVEKYEKGIFIIREEVSTDMPCGAEVIPTDITKITRYALPISHLISENGEFMIGLAYGKGC